MKNCPDCDAAPGEPIGHRYSGPAPEQPKRAYPTCACGAWVLGSMCEFCSRRRP